MDVPAWIADYVGLPFKAHGRERNGVDCWGLVRLVLAERFRLALPSYAGGYAGVEDAEDIGRLTGARRGLGARCHAATSGPATWFSCAS